MRILALLLAVLSVSTLAAWSCGDDVSKPAGMVADEGRLGALVEKIGAAKDGWSAAMGARDAEISAREAEWNRQNQKVIDELKAKHGRDAYKTPEWREMQEKFSFDNRLKFIYDSEPSRVVTPARRVAQTLYLCGSQILEDGHRINAGSSWVFQLPPAVGFSVSGVEMHYLLEHKQARPELIEKLERFFDEAPAPRPEQRSSLDAERTRSRVASVAVPSWN